MHAHTHTPTAPQSCMVPGGISSFSLRGSWSSCPPLPTRVWPKEPLATDCRSSRQRGLPANSAAVNLLGALPPTSEKAGNITLRHLTAPRLAAVSFSATASLNMVTLVGHPWHHSEEWSLGAKAATSFVQIASNCTRMPGWGAQSPACCPCSYAESEVSEKWMALPGAFWKWLWWYHDITNYYQGRLVMRRHLGQGKPQLGISVCAYIANSQFPRQRPCTTHQSLLLHRLQFQFPIKKVPLPLHGCWKDKKRVQYPSSLKKMQN